MGVPETGTETPVGILIVGQGRLHHQKGEEEKSRVPCRLNSEPKRIPIKV